MEKRLEHIKNLEDGWNGKQSLRISRKVITILSSMLHSLNNSIYVVEISAMDDGCIGINSGYSVHAVISDNYMTLFEFSNHFEPIYYDYCNYLENSLGDCLFEIFLMSIKRNY